MSYNSSLDELDWSVEPAVWTPSSDGLGYPPATQQDRNTRKALQPLLSCLQDYDTLRRRLEQWGGTPDDFARVADLLNDKIALRSHYTKHSPSLTDQASLRRALTDVGGFNLRLDIRQLDTGMPVYYICRTRNDYWSEYSLIVEDIYLSPGYVMTEERFVKLMDFGHESYYLRLAQFREQIEEMLDAENKGSGHTNNEWQVDDLLYSLGRHVFQAAWHEDQRPGMLAATHFGLENFRHAIELLYLCLSGELCELRSAVDGRMLQFFQAIYPQPALHAFLKMLPHLDGGVLNEFPDKALKLYAMLAKAFGEFIAVEVPWGPNQNEMPLYKLLFANLNRLHLVADPLHGNETLQKAVNRIEEKAQGVILNILDEQDRLPMAQ